MSGRLLGWVLLAGVGIANVAGYAVDLYQHFWWFDRILHGATIFALTFWLALFVFSRSLRAGRRAAIAVLIASVGIAVGALWEVAEWGFDQVAPGNVIKGKFDSVLDILMDTAGAALAGMTSLPFLRSSRTNDEASIG